MTRLQGIQSNRAKAFARKIDAIRTTSKVQAPNVRVDITAPTVIENPITGTVSVERKPLAKLGHTPIVNGKSHGTIATPSSYGIWLKAGCPAHPIYNREAWRRERYRDNIALPTGGPMADTGSKRHERDCTCVICSEYRTSLERKRVPHSGISGRDLAPIRAVVTRRIIQVTAPPLRAKDLRRS